MKCRFSPRPAALEICDAQPDKTAAAHSQQTDDLMTAKCEIAGGDFAVWHRFTSERQRRQRKN